ncbi:MAG: hypothetical protein CL930_14615 [Deltaproteobacteria bacterium]|nr:hypothetical protein [Deltaproteobacteria bacterium]
MFKKATQVQMKLHRFSTLTPLLVHMGCATSKAITSPAYTPPGAPAIAKRIPETQGEKTLLGRFGPTYCVDNPDADALVHADVTEPTPPQTAPWRIENGMVGEIAVGKPIPQSAFDIEGKSARQLLYRKLRWKSYPRAMRAGLVDMDGFRVMRLPTLDLEIRLTLKDNVFSIEPGPTVRTPDGLGIGSTIEDMEKVHGQRNLSYVPEPFHCVATIPDHHTSFLFLDCTSACAGAGARAVYIGGYDGPEDELPWGDDPPGTE